MIKKFDFDDILIEPSKLTDIRSRSQINVLRDGWLPLFAAPMDTVVNKENVGHFINEGIMPVLPRMNMTDNYLEHITNQHFISFSLEDFEKIYLTNTVDRPSMALIDIANGHMKDLLMVSKIAKEKYGDKLVLMVGNIANPSTFVEFAKINVDYVRVGIGNGGGCLTTYQTGIGYPMASLITETYDFCLEFLNKKRHTKIVADGGFKKYSDIIKALGLGADYVMIGSLFNRALESAGTTTNLDGEVIDQFSENAKNYIELGIPLFKNFRGMSTKEVQKEWGKSKLTTSEGVVRKNQVEYTLNGWTTNFIDYLKSAMSYSNHKDINTFIGGVNYNFITPSSFNRFNK